MVRSFSFDAFEGDLFPHPFLNSFVRTQGQVWKEYDERITTYMERFENLIKSEGEDSGPGSGGHHRLPSTFYPALRVPPPPEHVMARHNGVLPV